MELFSMILKLLKVSFWGCLEAVWIWSCWRFYSAAVLKLYDSEDAERFILGCLEAVWFWRCWRFNSEAFIKLYVEFWSCWRFYSEAVLKLYDSEGAEGFILRLSWSCMNWNCWRFYSEAVLKLYESEIAEGFILYLQLSWSCMILTLLKVLFCGCLEVVWFWSCWRFYSETVMKLYDSEIAESFILRLLWSCMILKSLKILFWVCNGAVQYDSELTEGFILRLSWSCMNLKLLKVLFCSCFEAVWFWSCWRFYSEAVLKLYDSEVAALLYIFYTANPVWFINSRKSFSIGSIPISNYMFLNRILNFRCELWTDSCGGQASKAPPPLIQLLEWNNSSLFFCGSCQLRNCSISISLSPPPPQCPHYWIVS